MLDIKLNEAHDLDITDYDLSIVSEVDKIVQNLKIRLLFFYTEWYLDTSIGIPYFDDILIKSPDIGNVEAIIIDAILNTPDVLELLSFDSFFDNAKRVYSVEFKVNTTYGISTNINQELAA